MKLRRHGALLLVFCVLAAAAPAQAAGPAVIANPAADGLTLYSGPSADSQALAGYFNGVYVTVTGEDGAWSAVVIGSPAGGSTANGSTAGGGSANGTNADGTAADDEAAAGCFAGGTHACGGRACGYMETACLFSSPDTAALAALPILTVQNENGTGLNLRRTPAAAKGGANRIGLYLNGAQVMVLGVWDGWLHVQAAGITGYMQSSGFAAPPQTPGTGAPPPPGTSTTFAAHCTLLDDHGYTVTAQVKEAPQGQYALTVDLDLGDFLLNGTLIGYNVYADGAYLGYLDATARVGGGQEGVPISFGGTFAVSDAISAFVLRPVWSRSGAKTDSEEDTGNAIVFLRGE